VIRGPEGVGEPAIAIVARPVQQAKLLLKAWLGASELPEDTVRPRPAPAAPGPHARAQPRPAQR